MGNTEQLTGVSGSCALACQGPFRSDAFVPNHQPNYTANNALMFSFRFEHMCCYVSFVMIKLNGGLFERTREKDEHVVSDQLES